MRFQRLFPVVLIALLFLLPRSYCASTLKETAYDFSLVGLDGKEVQLSSYKGKVLLIVNLASQSIYKNQLTGLKELQKTYEEKGLVILGIPSNDFGAEEPGDVNTIKSFYLTSEQVTFPIFARASLRGKDEIPLYRFLTNAKNGVPGGDVHWSYTKFLVDRNGKVAARFEVDTDPKDPDFLATVEKILNGTYKKKAAESEKTASSAGDGDPDDL
jgi:glutathione peroxidase